MNAEPSRIVQLLSELKALEPSPNVRESEPVGYEFSIADDKFSVELKLILERNFRSAWRHWTHENFTHGFAYHSPMMKLNVDAVYGAIWARKSRMQILTTEFLSNFKFRHESQQGDFTADIRQ